MRKTYVLLVLFAALGLMTLPLFTSADYFGGSYYNDNYGGNFITGGPIGNPCLIQIFHTDFAFPPEGGQIVQIGNQLYFDRTYLPGCGNTTSVASPVPYSSNNYAVSRYTVPVTNVYQSRQNCY